MQNFGYDLKKKIGSCDLTPLSMSFLRDWGNYANAVSKNILNLPEQKIISASAKEVMKQGISRAESCKCRFPTKLFAI